ncbi:MAG: hypothetical protein P8Q90_02705 [Candidatus Thalassarchaeaceae archaeon]|jgi:hypothetical protein|nr:hypothetical protein [Candidatus Thalassarchaeaceae archaeon]
MGLLSFLGFGSSDDYDDIDEASVQRLESLSEQAVEAVMVPEESIPIEEDAWTLAPSPARARVGASGLEPAVVDSKPASSDATTIDTKAIEQRLDDRFDRIEATMSIMDARLTQLHVTDNLAHVLPTDTLVTADGDGGEVEEQEAGEDGEESQPSESETVNLLDLYEGSVADLNPFLNRRPDSRSQGPSVTVSEISALLLDHLSAESAEVFIEKAKTSGMISKEESSELTAIIGLANPAINNDGSEHLPHRTLLMFGSMVDAWRNSRSTSGEGA